MVFAALLVLMSFPQVDDGVKSANVSTAAVERPSSPAEPAGSDAKDASAAAALPSAPAPKVKTDAEAIEPSSSGQPIQPMKPAVKGTSETPRQRKLWYALTIAGSGGAAFDAWSTRRAISGGYGQESNPLLAPFAHSNALYAATQVSPAVMDFIGKRMMTSEYPALRKLWWLPQTVGAGLSFGAAAHNVSLVH